MVFKNLYMIEPNEDLAKIVGSETETLAAKIGRLAKYVKSNNLGRKVPNPKYVPKKD